MKHFLFALTVGSLLSGPAVADRLPQHLQRDLSWERVNNRLWTSSPDPIPIPSDFPNQFDPQQSEFFEIPYVDVPRDRLHILTSRGQRIGHHPSVDATLRFYVHPLSSNHFAHFVQDPTLTRGTATAYAKSSFRTLIVHDSPRPPLEIKTSLDTTILGLSRLVDAKELHRSRAIDDIVEEITPKDQRDYGFSFVREPLQVIDPHTQTGFLVKRLDESLLPEGRDLIPGFSLFSADPGSPHQFLVDRFRAKSDGVSRSEFAVEKILRPLLRAVVHLTYEHGLVGQPHPQNILFVADADGSLIPHIVIRDLEAFRPDPELRYLRGRPNDVLFARERPAESLFLYGFDYYRRFYASYILDAWAYPLARYLHGVPTAKALPTFVKLAKRIITEEFVKEFERQTEITFDAPPIFARAEAAQVAALRLKTHLSKTSRGQAAHRLQFRDFSTDWILGVRDGRAVAEAYALGRNWNAIRYPDFTVIMSPKSETNRKAMLIHSGVCRRALLNIRP